MTRSWWGWGDVEQSVVGAEAEGLVARIRMALPDHDFTVHDPPDPAALPVPKPRVGPPASLADIATGDAVDRLGHARGKALRDVVRNLSGEIGPVPDLVVRPRHERDVIDVLDWCGSASVAVVPYGGGSSVVGGVEPRFDGPSVSLDLTSMDQVLTVDPISQTALIQAGAFGPHLENQLRPHGLTLRHFPQSFEFSTLGGWLATRAGGHFATVYTHIDDLTSSMRVVTPSGVVESRRLPGSGAGPSPDRLFLGSEGTLGIITQAWMRVRPRPTWKQTASLIFSSFEQAVDATRALAQSGLHPSNARLLDPGEALVSAGIATDGGVLVVGFESADHPVDAWIGRAIDLVTSHGGTLVTHTGPEGNGSASTDPAAAWRSSFLRMPYQRDALARRSIIAETFETACTWDGFADLHAAVSEAAHDALARVCGGGLLTCRFTHIYPDGPAPYYGVIAPGRWGAMVEQWDEVKSAVSEAIIDHGGTITHHHAVGRDHRPWYLRQRPDPFAAALRAAKATLDPAGILNPGVLL